MVVFVLHQSTTRFVRDFVSERLGFVSSAVFDGIALSLCCMFAMLELQDEESSKQTCCMVCVSPFSPEPSCEPPPHIFETYQSIARQYRTNQTVAENGCFWLFGVQQTRHVVHCWALRIGNRAFAVFLERAGSDSCHVRAALHVTF